MRRGAAVRRRVLSGPILRRLPRRARMDAPQRLRGEPDRRAAAQARGARSAMPRVPVRGPDADRRASPDADARERERDVPTHPLLPRLREHPRRAAARVLLEVVPQGVEEIHRGPLRARRVARVSGARQAGWMPLKPPHGCAEPGCPELVRHSPRCAAHTRSERRVSDRRRGSSASRGYGLEWRALRLRFLRLHPLCVECARSGLTVAATDVDHIVARSRGGSDHHTNLQGLCHACHSRKTSREDGAFGRRRIG